MQKLQFLAAILVLSGATLIGTSGLKAEDEPAARRVCLLFEGLFESPEVAQPLQGAKLTQLVPFYEWDYGIRSFDEDYWTENQFTWERITAISKRVADGLLEKIRPDVIRDERGIVDYVIIHDKDPFLTSILLSDKLLEKFKDTLGDQIYAICIDRNLVYLFPGTGGRLDEYGPSLVDEFRQTPLPVSLEIFLIDSDGYRVFGELERDPAG